MELADIDWKRVEWRFVRDDLYEHFNAPKWVDLAAPCLGGSSAPSAIPPDEAWFCRPGMRKPTNVAGEHFSFGGVDDGSPCAMNPMNVQTNARRSAYQDLDELQSLALAYLQRS